MVRFWIVTGILCAAGFALYYQHFVGGFRKSRGFVASFGFEYEPVIVFLRGFRAEPQSLIHVVGGHYLGIDRIAPPHLAGSRAGGDLDDKTASVAIELERE